MLAINVLVPDPAGAPVEARVASGEYAGASEYVSDLILRNGADGDTDCSPELEAAILSGLADAEAGRLHDAEKVFDRLRSKYTAMADAASR